MRERIKLFILPLLLALTIHRAAAQDLPTADTPSLIEAEEINYDENLGVVTASGNVEISQEDRVLKADSVSYNMRTDIVSASGNVRLIEPSGEVISSEFFEITGDLKEGFIRDIRILMTDNSRLAGATGQRTAGAYTEVNKGVFSPCELCRDDPTRPPLWQLKAERVIHDQEDQTIRYHDAWMEIYGVPVMYVPYFEHPDPTVKRKSGFLTPSFGQSESLGTTIQIPYFWEIDDDKDLTVAPIFTTKQNAAFFGEYRQAFANGELEVIGSATIADREEKENETDRDVLRGHIDAKGRFDLDDTWRIGFDAKRTSDDTYLRVYNIDGNSTLTSRAYLEGFRGRNYFSANSFYYQVQREEEEDDEAPIISPLIDYNFVSQPLWMNSTINLDTNLLVLTRTDGRDSNRLSLHSGWQMPFSGPLGDRFELSASLAADGYWVKDVSTESTAFSPEGRIKNDLTGRLFPQLALNWRYPLIQTNEGFSQIVEPVAQLVTAFDGSNPKTIPNEDSIDFEFDDTNLFSKNRFTGIDRVDPGPRMDYGLKWSIMGDDGAYGTAFIGQSYRLAEIDDDQLFPEDSGVEDNFSDIVGRVEFRPSRYVDLLYRFRFDKENLSPRRAEVDARLGSKALSLDLTYVFLDDNTGSEEFSDKREEMKVEVSSQIARYWSIYANHRRDMQRDEALSWEAGITYEDECFRVKGVFERSFFNDRDVAQEDAFFVSVSFKHLGSIGGGN